ncbi:hypothetical protein ACFXDE_02110 [Kitasatospora sp. NPDC059408]|uniref:hypothetical protein n=1 Tax=Kitasatospora sp. NPDC059408 TaxID=3346823 RepID=UPI003694B895
MATPYITPAMLLAQPAGISWRVMPTLTADTPSQLAQIQQVCWSATAVVDSYCRQPLRSVIVTETNAGPGGPRVAVDRHTQLGTLIARHRHLSDVWAVLVSPSRSFPPAWSPVAAGQFRLRTPVSFAGPGPATGPSGGSAIDVAAGWIDWRQGRGGWQVQSSCSSGWPHAGLTVAAAAGAMSISVDDVTGWGGAHGTAGFLYDGAASENIAVSSATAATPTVLPNTAIAVQAGPGTIQLAQPLTQAHPVGAVVSALPANVIHAAGLAAAVEALEGIDAIATQSLSGQLAGGTGALATEVEMLLDDYRRVV